MIDDTYDHPYKIYVSVLVKFDECGNIMPRSIIWSDGITYDIDRVLSVEKVASIKAGGVGMRYELEIRGQRRYIWLEETRWFMEKND